MSVPKPPKPTLQRALGLRQATVLSMIDMVGIGPFTALPIIMLAFPGKFSLIPWLIGAVVSFADGLVWSELGSAWPQAGGSYVFLRKLYRGGFGRFMAFLYVVQTSFHLPLVMTSAAIGFVNYFNYLVPLNFWEGKVVMVALVSLVVILLYRKIGDVGRIGFFFSIVVVFLLLWTIATGAWAFDAARYAQNSVLPDFLTDWRSSAFWLVAGSYSSKTIYAFLGYYNVCHLGSEIKNPQRNIPLSIMISIGCIAVLYLLMQWTMAGAAPQEWIRNENVPLISLLFESVYGKGTAYLATGILLLVALSSLFALMLGYTRILYAAAKEGMHFPIFAHLHPKGNFPDYALLIFGAIAALFCLLFDKPSQVFGFIVVTRIFIQFIPQAIGVLLLRKNGRQGELNYKMPFFPFPAILSALIWLFVFLSSGYTYFWSGLAVIALGSIIYYLFFKWKEVQS
ncbi:APC family permease [Olivibacter sitiensis]|uniref:APC family permease n=1 Tax=Olivibacter sitiensis TaxID=376470 RepID=UPI000402B3E4|nr:APC family permease [Olivibacter sitiensis]